MILVWIGITCFALLESLLETSGHTMQVYLYVICPFKRKSVWKEKKMFYLLVYRNKQLLGSFAKLRKRLLPSSRLTAWNNSAFLRYALLAYKFLCKIQYMWGLMSSGIWRRFGGFPPQPPHSSKDLTVFILTFKQTMNMTLWRVGNFSPNDTASHSRRYELSVTPLW
jgi:hypothetical protein